MAKNIFVHLPFLTVNCFVGIRKLLPGVLELGVTPVGAVYTGIGGGRAEHSHWLNLFTPGHKITLKNLYKYW